jgi:glycosyltransferase involved in cell wall biosynthesis
VTSGAHLRDFHLARQLSLNYELLYLAFDNGSGTGAAGRSPRLPELNDSRVVLVPRGKGYGALQLLRGALGSTPISVLNYTTNDMRQALRGILQAESFDFVQVEGVHLYAYLPLIRALAPKATILMDWHNVESELMDRYADNIGSIARRWYARRTARQLYNCEQRLLLECRAHTVCSEREQAQLLERAPGAAVEVITNGVDVDFFAAMPTGAASSTPVSTTDNARRSIAFVGSMSYHANVDAACYFVEAIWPTIRERRPELEFRIVGSNPTAQVQALRNQPGVVVTGTVDDVRPYYREALAVVVPLRVGGGTRLKVLEAMAAGTPVISTSLGAEGLDVTHGSNILLADDAAAIADAVVNMQVHDERWQQLVENGRRLVAASYDWSSIGQKLRSFYSRVGG